ncbi:tetratricopeptide repeat protein [Streptomyces sp. NPDC004267]|uniref:tetratricopeptide repeat protein n=1 Tax=Streptomyces sp. NPDC004267 TaxID=3364694 RepID=UPI003681F5BE
MDVRGGAVGVGRDAPYSAIGPHSTVIVHEAPAQGPDAVPWPLEIGTVPLLASAFQPRTELRERIDAVRADGRAAVLTQVLSGGGGVGKSQLAASYAARAVADGTDLVVWAPATEVQQVVTLYAEAAVRVSAPGASGENPEADARAFLSWLTTTSRRWLVVLDDITDPAGMDRWWPVSHTGTGWALATTRLHDARLTGGGRRRVDVDVYEPGEAAAYLRTRLADDAGLADDSVDALAAELGYLPLALGHAAAYMINDGLTCTAYLELFRDSRSIAEVLPASADSEGYGRRIATTLLLSLDAARAAGPAGLAEPVLRLAALLDPAGHPEDFWATPEVRVYLGGCETETVRAALRVLHRYALLTRDSGAVRVHALTARAVREAIPPQELAELAHTAAGALLTLWPDPDQPYRDLAAVLRANTDSLVANAGDHLWAEEGHPLLYWAGHSLLRAGLTEAATAYWQALVATLEPALGPDHEDTLNALGGLGFSHWQAGRSAQAIELEERVLAHLEQRAPEHSDTLVAKANLASSYRQAGRLAEGTALSEQVLADSERLFGPEDPNTIAERHNLASSYYRMDRFDEAVALGRRVVVDCESVFGADHPATLSARANLAVALQATLGPDETIELEEQVLADRERVLGTEHPDTITSRANLAASYSRAGRDADALALLTQAVAEAERVLAPGHPDLVVYQEALAMLLHAHPRPRPRLRRLFRR